MNTCLSGVVTEMTVIVIWYQQKQKLKNAISDVAIKGSHSIILKEYVRVRKTLEPFQVFSFPISSGNYLEQVI